MLPVDRRELVERADHQSVATPALVVPAVYGVGVDSGCHRSTQLSIGSSRSASAFPAHSLSVLGCSSLAARQLASRARRRVRGCTMASVGAIAQRRAVDAFIAAVHDADFEALLAVLNPDVV